MGLDKFLGCGRVEVSTTEGEGTMNIHNRGAPSWDFDEMKIFNVNNLSDDHDAGRAPGGPIGQNHDLF